MKQTLFALMLLFPFVASAQIVKPGQDFTEVYTFDGKVVFLKEILLKSKDIEKNYFGLREWMKANYSGDPFVSSVDFDKKNHRSVVKSRIELLLPENSQGARNKVIMKFNYTALIKNDLCVMEITNVSFLNNYKENQNTLPEKISAEDIISDTAVAVNDANSEFRRNTRKSVLYFFNELGHELENALNK